MLVPRSIESVGEQIFLTIQNVRRADDSAQIFEHAGTRRSRHLSARARDDRTRWSVAFLPIVTYEADWERRCAARLHRDAAEEAMDRPSPISAPRGSRTVLPR